MTAPALRVLVLLAAAGCGSSSSSPPVDAAGEPIIAYEDVASATWSLSITGGMAQLSITDGAGADACALAADQHHALRSARQIVLQLPGTVTGPCPPGPDYTLTPNCPATLGAAAYVPAGCAFFRKWDAQGNSLGIAVARDAVIKIGGGGNATSCTIQANIGFFGGSFKGMVELRDGATAQPWCGT